jgi:hypothetical protein
MNTSDKIVKNSDKLKSVKVPDVLNIGYEFDLEKLIYVDNKVKCKGCGESIAFNLETRTSNLISHLKTNAIKHRDLCLLYDNSKLNSTNGTPKRKRLFEEIENLTSGAPSPKTPKLITDFSQAKYKNHDLKKVYLDKLFLDMLCANSLSINFACSPELKKIFEVLDGRYQIPSRNTIVNTLIPERYKSLNNTLKLKLEEVHSINISLDIWSDGNMRSFMYSDEPEDFEKTTLINQVIDKYLAVANEFYHQHMRTEDSSTKVKPFVDAILFWRKYHNDFPVLGKIAKKLLAIPATSAAVERFFSKTGYIMRPHRRCLKDDLATKLFIIKANGRLLDLDKENK